MHGKMPKIPISVLVVIYTTALEVLLIERADKTGFWQSVTGSLDHYDETLAAAAAREVYEETGIDIANTANCTLSDWQYNVEYDIYPHWRYRYATDITRNTEHWFGLQVPSVMPITLAPHEHVQSLWLPYQEAAERCFSKSNAEAILSLPQYTRGKYYKE